FVDARGPVALVDAARSPEQHPMARLDAERNLLFGLLALQNGLIDQDQLVAAFRAWTRDKARPMAEVLTGQGAIDADDRAALEALAARHLKHHGGDPEKSLAALHVGGSTRESLAAVGDLEVGATLARVGSGPTSKGSGPVDRTTSYAVGSATSDGQRF